MSSTSLLKFEFLTAKGARPHSLPFAIDTKLFPFFFPFIQFPLGEDCISNNTTGQNSNQIKSIRLLRKHDQTPHEYIERLTGV